MLKKIIKIGSVTILVLLLLLFALPFVFKGKIEQKAKDNINNSINAKVNWTEFDLALLSTFPNMTISFFDLSVIGIEEFSTDTLAYVQTLKVKLNLFDVITGSQITVNSILMDKSLVNIIILKNGKANYDIAKPDSSATGSTDESRPFKFALKSYELKNTDISYKDEQAGMQMLLSNLNHSGKGDFSEDFFTLSTMTEIESTNFSYGNIAYLNKVKTNFKADLDMDMQNMKFTFKENEIALNELALSFDGWVAIPDEDIRMDIIWNLKKNEFRNFVSMIPGVYRKGFDQLKSKGTLALSGFAKGIYNEKSLPAFNLILKVENGMFQYPSLPMAVNNVWIDLNIKNPDGIMDHTIIDLKKLQLDLGKEHFEAHAFISTPESDANIDIGAKGSVNLSNIKNVIPLESETQLTGIITADVTAKGRYSAIEQKQYENFNAAGSLLVSSMEYKSNDYPATVINKLSLTFNPKNVTLNELSAKSGSSDFKANGSVDNLLAYYFKNEMLKGNFALQSQQINLNEFMSEGPNANTTVDTAAMKVFEVPANIDFTLKAQIANLIYDNLQLKNTNGLIRIHDEKIDLQNLMFSMLDGNAKMSGYYETTQPKSPGFQYELALSNFNINKTFEAFNTVKKLAPIAGHCSGLFSTTMTVNGKLTENMQPEINSLSGKGSMNTNKVVLNNFEPLNKMADALKLEQFKKLQPGDMKINYKFENGRVTVDPFTTKFYGTSALIEGSNGFDQSIDYKAKLEIPKSSMNQKAVEMMNGLFVKANAAAGTNIQMPDPVKVNVLIGGTVMKPEVKTDLAKQANDIKENIKEQITVKVNEEIEKQKQKAREEADKILKEAEVEAKQIRDAAKVTADKAKKEGYAAADKLVKDTSNPLAKMAAEETAKKMKKETDKQSQNIIKEGDKKAQQLLEEARKKSDALLK